jgi:hypothetical protein
MPRRNLIALAGSVVVVLLAVWGVTHFFFGKTDPIVGKWRADASPQCDAGANTLTVARDHVDIQRANEPAMRILTIVAFEAEGDAHRLRVTYGKDIEDIEADFALFVPYQVAGDTLTFGKVEWTPEARAKYPNQIVMVEGAVGSSMDDLIGESFRAEQPYHRCPD